MENGTGAIPVYIEIVTTGSVKNVNIFLQCCSAITYRNGSSWLHRPACCIR